MLHLIFTHFSLKKINLFLHFNVHSTHFNYKNLNRNIGNTNLLMVKILVIFQLSYEPYFDNKRHTHYCLFIEQLWKTINCFVISNFFLWRKQQKKWKMSDKKNNDSNNPNLGCLEEDDEFEEFPVEGKLIIC